MHQRVQRIFAGWDQPFLHSLRDFLIRNVELIPRRAVDLSHITVALPGSRAGRRLIELLVGAPAARDHGLIPPRVLTVGALAAAALPADGNVPGTLTREFAWLAAIKRLGTATVAPLLPDLPRADELARLLGTGRTLDAWHAECAGAMLTFEQVARSAANLLSESELQRWHAAAAIQQEYLRVLAESGLVDDHTSRLHRLAEPVPPLEWDSHELVLAGIADMNEAQRRIIGRVAESGSPVVAIVFAPEEHTARFDQLGCVLPERWEDVPIELNAANIRIVEGPRDQAVEAISAAVAIAAPAGVGADNVTLGAADDEVIPHIERLAQRSDASNMPVRRAAGTPLTATPPFRLLLAAADFLDSGGWGALATLVRHPDVEKYLQTRWATERGERDVLSWLEVMDSYQRDHLPGALTGVFQTGDPAQGAILAWLWASVEELLAPLQRTRGSPEESLAQTASDIWQLLLAVYREPGATATTSLSACEVLHAALAELAAAPPGLIDFSGTPSGAIRAVLHSVSEEAIPDEGAEAAAELLGWLELPMDDARVMVITGMNEGRVPASPGVDPMLPDSLRSALGLVDRRRRYARDAFALSAIAASRHDLVLLAGRRTGANDPLAPSRLLFACSDDETVRRAERWMVRSEQRTPSATVLPGTAPDGRRSLFVPCPLPAAPLGTLTSMRVTSFKDYIESPYGFYLKHIARLEEVDDKAVEMDPLRFGNLIHDCLKMLKDSDQARSDNPDRIAAFLCANLDALSAQWFGDTTLPTVRLQLAHAKLRLREFARWQAENARLGWKILHTEWNPDPGAAFIDVDGVPMGLRGRIDRIDIDEAEGILRVLDYKTGESAADPKSTRSRDGRWKDLQLPLYRHLVKPLGAVDRIQLGFFALPKSIAHTAFNEAEWDETDLAAADDAAREVIRAVRAGRFDDIGTSPPSEGILSAICGQGMSLEDEEDDTEDPA